MRVKIDIGGGSPPVWLAGEPGVGQRTFTEVNEMISNGTLVADPVGFLRGNYRTVFNRKNKGEDITFTSTRKYNTLQDAERYHLEHWTRVPGRGLITFQVLDGGTVSIERWLNGAVIESIQRRQIGVTVFYGYHILGGEMLSAQPLTILA